MSKSMKFLLVAGVVSLAVASPVQAGGRVSGGGDFHASAGRACDGTSRTQNKAEDGLLSRNRCRVLADDTGPGNPGDHNGRAELSTDTHQIFATEGPPTNAGDHNGRSAALSQGSQECRVAGGRVGGGGDVSLQIDTHRMFAGGR